MSWSGTVTWLLLWLPPSPRALLSGHRLGPLIFVSSCPVPRGALNLARTEGAAQPGQA